MGNCRQCSNTGRVITTIRSVREKDTNIVEVISARGMLSKGIESVSCVCSPLQGKKVMSPSSPFVEGW